MSNDQSNESDARLQAVLDGVVDGIITIDQKGIIEDYNKACESIFGYEAKEAIGQNVKILMPEPFHGEHDGYLKNYSDTGEKKIIGLGREVEGRRKDGTTFHLDLSVSEVIVGDKKVFTGIVRDISDRIQSEEMLKQTYDKLKEREERLQAVLHHTIDGIVTIDAMGTIETFNAACENLFGYSAEEAIGQNIKILMPEPFHGEHDGYLKKYSDTGNKTIIGIGREVDGKRKDGSIFPLDLSVSEVKATGRVLYSGILRDISMRKRAEQEILRSNEELDNFAFIAAHDLKEPLRAINNHASFLLEDYEEILEGDGVKRLHRLTYLTKRMEKLISDLLAYSRLGRENMSGKDTDLNIIIDDLKNTMQDLLIENKVVINIPKALPTVACNAVRITEMYRNLIVNAVKYNESEEKIIEIGFKNSNDNVFYVKDNGIGIEEEFHKEIFRIFKRLHSEKKYGGGSGSGLTFVKKIIEQHGGEIWLESKQGEGTTFCFTLSSLYKSGAPT